MVKLSFELLDRNKCDLLISFYYFYLVNSRAGSFDWPTPIIPSWPIWQEKRGLKAAIVYNRYLSCAVQGWLQCKRQPFHQLSFCHLIAFRSPQEKSLQSAKIQLKGLCCDFFRLLICGRVGCFLGRENCEERILFFFFSESYEQFPRMHYHWQKKHNNKKTATD